MTGPATDPVLAHSVGRPGTDPATIFAREKANCSEIFYKLLRGWGYCTEPFTDFRSFHRWRWNTYHTTHPPPPVSRLCRAIREEDHAAILFVRDPVARALSQWKHYRSCWPEFKVRREREPFATPEAFFGALGDQWGRDGLVIYSPQARSLDVHWASQAFHGIRDVPWTLAVPVEKMHSDTVVEEVRRLTGVDVSSSFSSSHWHGQPAEEELAVVRPYVDALYDRDVALYASVLESFDQTMISDRQ